MHKTHDKSQIYYVYDSHGNTCKRIGDEESLITWLRHTPGILRELNLTGNDTVHDYYPHYREGFLEYEKIINLRRYVILDGLNRIVDVRYLIPYSFETDWHSVWRRRKVSWYKGVEFRKDPVPHTGHHKNYWAYRHVQTQQERRLNAGPEYREYVRPARRSNRLVNSWDEISRTHSRSWKDQSKQKKQWM